MVWCVACVYRLEAIHIELILFYRAIAGDIFNFFFPYTDDEWVPEVVVKCYVDCRYGGEMRYLVVTSQ